MNCKRIFFLEINNINNINNTYKNSKRFLLTVKKTYSYDAMIFCYLKIYIA